MWDQEINPFHKDLADTRAPYWAGVKGHLLAVRNLHPASQLFTTEDVSLTCGQISRAAQQQELKVAVSLWKGDLIQPT